MMNNWSKEAEELTLPKHQREPEPVSRLSGRFSKTRIEWSNFTEATWSKFSPSLHCYNHVYV